MWADLSCQASLRMKDGTKVARARQWPTRRAEILEDFEREVYGSIPPNVPKVTWEVTATTNGEAGGIPTVTKTLLGHVDNSADPEITVNIQASFTVPAEVGKPVPIMIEFGFGGPGFRRRNRRPTHDASDHRRRGGLGARAPRAMALAPSPVAVTPRRFSVPS